MEGRLHFQPPSEIISLEDGRKYGERVARDDQELQECLVIADNLQDYRCQELSSVIPKNMMLLLSVAGLNHRQTLHNVFLRVYRGRNRAVVSPE